jgi:hypothetical protein
LDRWWAFSCCDGSCCGSRHVGCCGPGGSAHLSS